MKPPYDSLGLPAHATSDELVIGVLADTHDLLRPEALDAVRGCDAIVHAGDVCTPELLQELTRVAPVACVRGNNDRGEWARELPEHARLEIAGVSWLVVHDAADVSLSGPFGTGVDLVVTGHSHNPRHELRNGVQWLNPGSAGPRRFRLPIALARVSIRGGEATVTGVRLAVEHGPRQRTGARGVVARP